MKTVVGQTAKKLSDLCIKNVEIIIIVLIPVIVFFPYLTGKTAFVFGGIASDSVVQTYPDMVYKANRIANGDFTEGFSFITALGEYEEALYPNLSNWFCFFGQKNVAYLLGVDAFLKMLLCGVFCYLLSSLFRIKGVERLIVSVGYETCSMITVRAAWHSYKTLALLVIVWLYVFELFVRRRGIKAAILLLGVSILFLFESSLYFSLFYGGVFIIYAVFRMLNGHFNRSFIRYGIIISGLLIACLLIMLSQNREIFASIRFQNGIQLFKSSVEDVSLFDLSLIPEVITRSVGNVIGGISSDFIGKFNYLEGPALYCGIPMILFLPLSIYNLPGTQKHGLIVAYIMAVLYIIMPSLVILLSGMSGQKYKLSSFWITIIMLYTILSFYEEMKKDNSELRKGSVLIVNTTALVLISVLLYVKVAGGVARRKWFLFSLLLILMYTLLFNVQQKDAKGVMISKAAYLMLFLEGVAMSYGAINGNISFSKGQLDGLYLDDMSLAVDQIKNDDTTWYRIEKYPESFNFCDALIQNYYGTTGYVGGVGVNQNIISFFRKLGLPGSGTSKIFGTGGNFYANSYLGVKYIIKKNEPSTQFGLILKSSYDNICVYENQYALPVGFVYKNYVYEDQITEVDMIDANRMLLDICIIEKSHDEMSNVNLTEYFSRGRDSLRYSHTLYPNNKKIPLESEVDHPLYLIDVSFDKEEHEYQNEFLGLNHDVSAYYVSDQDDNYAHFHYAHGAPIEVYGKDAKELSFYSNAEHLINDIQVCCYDADEYYNNILGSISSLQLCGLEIESFKKNEIQGSVNAKYEGIFATSIPYNEKWHIYIDDVEQELLKVNTGFIGSKIKEGDHRIRVCFEHREWVYGLIIRWTIFLIILGLYVIYEISERGSGRVINE